jgi:DNA cross-link repair 1A protein
MSSRGKKRQKTDPSPIKPDTKTLFHFFARPSGNGVLASEPSPPKTDSDSSSEYRRHSDGVFGVADAIVKTEMTPPRMLEDVDRSILESKPMQFEAAFTEANDTCSPMKEEQDEIDPFEGIDFQDDEFQEEDFRDEELDTYEDIDDFSSIKPEPATEINDPTCPFCNFSFKGLSENVSLTLTLTQLITLHANRCLDDTPTSPPRKLAWTPRPAQLQPSGTTPTSTAFSKIMSSNAEDKAWKTAAITEQLRGLRAAIRPCPFYKIMPEMPGFAVDAFRYGRVEGIRGYFLT